MFVKTRMLAALLVTASIAATGAARAAAPAPAAPPAKSKSPAPGEKSASAPAGPSQAPRGKIEWMDWDVDALRLAAVRNRPILLNVVVSWSRQCRDMEKVWADPRVVAAVSAGWIAVKVDAERRPDVRERYPSSTWPAVTLLLPNGVPYFAAKENNKVPSRVTIGAVPPERIVKLLGEARDFLRNPEKIPALKKTVEEGLKAEAEAALEPGRIDPATATKILETLRINFDSLHGGWTKAPKFPMPAPIEACLFSYSSEKDKRLLEVAEKALHAITDGPLFDKVDGGVHRIAANDDWSQPEYEKLLDRNVALLDQLLNARILTSKPEYAERAADITRWLETTMKRQGGGYYASQSFDPASADGGGYYRLSAADRAKSAKPPVETLVLVGWSAKAAAAEMRAAYILARPDLAMSGRQTLDWLLDQAYERGRGVVHAIDGQTRILATSLEDQVLFAEASLDAYQTTGDRRYQAAARDVVEVAIANLRNPKTLLFADIVANPRDPALPMRTPIHSFEWNCRMARLLARLFYLNRQEKIFRDSSLAILEAYSQGYARGPNASLYAMALSEYHEGPMWVWIIGSAKIPGTPSMFASVTNVPTLWKLVVQLDPGDLADAKTITQMGFVYRKPPAVYFTSGTHTSRPAQFPSEVPQSYKALVDVLAQDHAREAEEAAKAAAGASAEGDGTATPPKKEGAPPAPDGGTGGDGSR